jgi:hypothetical protein
MIIEDAAIQHPHRGLYSPIHRASLPPEPAFRALR